MSVGKMSVCRLDHLNEDTPAVEYDSGLVGATTDWIIVPEQVRNLAYVLDIPSSANCRVEISTTSTATIQEEGTVIISPWAKGDVTASTEDASIRINAFRLFITSGNAQLLVNGK